MMTMTTTMMALKVISAIYSIVLIAAAFVSLPQSKGKPVYGQAVALALSVILLIYVILS